MKQQQVDGLGILVCYNHWISQARTDLHMSQMPCDWCTSKEASATSSSTWPDSAWWLLPKLAPWEGKEKRSTLFSAVLWLRQETEITCPWEEMSFWQWCRYIDPLTLSWGRTTWLHLVIDRRGRLQALCFFYLEKHAGTIFYLCGTSKGRAGERGEGGFQEMENSRGAGFSALHYANRASEHDTETELINLILISQEVFFLPTQQYIHALQRKQITLCKWESCQFIFVTHLPPHHQHDCLTIE